MAPLVWRSGTKHQLYSLQKQIDDKSTDISKLKLERQRLQGLIYSQESDIEDLKRQISGHEKTNQDKDTTICSLKKKNQELEKLKFVFDFQLNQLKKQTELQHDDIHEKKEQLHQLKEELVRIDKNNTHLKCVVSDQRLKLSTRDKELHKEMQKVKVLETHHQRFKSDLHTCVSFIQEPKKLKDSVKMIYAKYVTEVDVMEKSSDDKDVQREFCVHLDHMQKTVNSLKARLGKSAKEHEEAKFKMIKENLALITEINELRKELHLVTTQVKEYKTQLAMLKKSNKPCPNSKDGPKEGPKHEDVK